MAKKAFEERAASAVKDVRARLSDMECLIAEGGLEIAPTRCL